ncbi:MAG TPA: GNAT family N-acetyltransferase [Pirellulales bacterium]|nr:GNAT family N-acetyltransferase [Pirellulales bacterium]
MKNVLNAITRFLRGFRRPTKAANTRLLRERGETLDSLEIRDATPNDIPALAELHVKTWTDTYWPVANPPTCQIRERQWREQFANNEGSWFCLVVENRDGELIGFAKGKRYASDDLPGYAGELNKIYLLRQYQRLGIGRRLVGHVARRFLSQGINSMVLFGTPQNPSCAFHEALGGQRLYAKNGEFHGGYGWRDLQQLASICPVEKVLHPTRRDR